MPSRDDSVLPVSSPASSPVSLTCKIISAFGALGAGASIGGHCAAGLEAIWSGASLSAALGLWSVLEPALVLGALCLGWVIHHLIHAALHVEPPVRFSALLLGIGALSGLSWSVERAHTLALAYVRDPNVLGPLLGLWVLGYTLVALTLLSAFAPQIIRVFKRIPLRATALLTLTSSMYLLTFALLTPLALLSRAELARPLGLVVMATFITLLVSRYVYATLCHSIRCQATLIARPSRLFALVISGLCINIALAARGLERYTHDERSRHALDEARLVTPHIARFVRTLSDRDQDGFGAWLGDGDCDDHAAHINPNALDIPDNGIDEDCDGEDAHLKEFTHDSFSSHQGFSSHQSTSVHESPPKPRERRVDTDHSLTSTRRNLLVITIDALRADRVSWSGSRDASHPNLTPNLETLTRAGLTFRHAYAPALSTRYSIPSLFSGAPLSELEFDWRGRYLYLNPSRSPLDKATLWRRLKRSGYRTAAYTGSLLTRGMWYGLERGIDHYVGLERATLRSKSSPLITRAGVDQLRAWCASQRGAHTPVQAPHASQASRATSSDTSPWALWLHYLDPHEPYLKYERHDFGTTPQDRYNAEIAATDHQIGVLLKALKRCGDTRDTVIVVTSDHGEEFGEHGRRFHGKQLFDESARVPLLIHVPGAPAVTISEPRSTLDMVETVHELLTLSPTSRARRRMFSHASRLEPNGAPPKPRPFFVYRLHNESPRLLALALIDDPYKLIYDVRSRRARLYNLKDDPREEIDLKVREPLRLRELSSRARAEVKRFKRHVHAQLTTRSHTPDLSQLLKYTALSQAPIAITPHLEILGARLSSRPVGTQTLYELSVWVRPSARLKRMVRFEARWGIAGEGTQTVRPVQARAGLHLSSRWTPGEVVELLSAERINPLHARHVELVVKISGETPRVFTLDPNTTSPLFNTAP